ncbi:unnamed protein product [Staurois parvus]|uniref:Uncharacterized protein n=1 Tax=Staurois parvus TaxID=386267 RepID=A0ABN9G4J7_9NEOB|nr:unnamed protein product [Staurois parvus]
MRGDKRVNCVLGVFYWGRCVWCFTVSTLPSRAVCPSRQEGGLLVNKAALLPIGDPW